jgi:nickel/cobalt transporter (NicO) family protein
LLSPRRSSATSIATATARCPGEQRAYGELVVSALTLDVDGTPVRTRLGAVAFPDTDAIKRGEGTIRLHSATPLPRLARGRHQLRFRNNHDPDRSVYLANALVPGSDDVAVSAQRRDENQTELTIDYELRAGTAASTDAWLLGGLAAAMVAALGIRRSRSVESKA